MWLAIPTSSLPFSLLALLCDVYSPQRIIQAIHTWLTSPLVLSKQDNPPAAKRRPAQRVGGHQCHPTGHQAPGSRTDHTSPRHILLLPWDPDTRHQPRFTPGELLFRAQGSGKPGLCPGLARHACDLICYHLNPFQLCNPK